jgi:hypothetical protein
VYGDAEAGRRSEPAAPGFAERISLAERDLESSSERLTSTSRDQFRFATEAFGEASKEAEALSNEVEELAQQLFDLGGPWTGR